MQGVPRRRVMTRRAFVQTAGVALAAIPLAAPAVASAQGATPAASAALSAIETMFARVPATLPEMEDATAAMIMFADIAAQLDAVGVTAPATVDDADFPAWVAATHALALPSAAAQYLTFWREDYGFDLLQADRTISIELPPFSLTILEGRFDQDAVRGALDALGYRAVEVGGHELLSIRGDFEQSLDAPTAYKLAAVNFVTFLDDGAIAFASAGAPLAAVLDVAAGSAPSMLETGGIGLLLDQAPPDLASALLVSGLSLAGSIPTSLIEADPDSTPDIGAIATEIAATSEMPPVVMALLVSTTGGPLMLGEGTPAPAGLPDAAVGVVTLMLTPESAELAAPVVEERLATGGSQQTGQPYTEFFAAADVAAVPGTPVLLVDLALVPGRSPMILMNMLFNRDLGFLAW